MSEQSTESTEQQPSSEETEQQPDTGQQPNLEQRLKDLEADRDKWQSLARKHEDRAKTNAEKAKGYDDLKASRMTEQEKAVETARSEARSEALREVAPHLVRLTFEAVAGNRLTEEQITELLEDVDSMKYLTESGEVDRERVTKKVDALAPKQEDREPVFPDLGQGRRTPATPDPGPGIARLRDAYATSSK